MAKLPAAEQARYRAGKSTTQSSKVYERVYEVVRQIPRGRVTTYGEIAWKLKVQNAELKVDARMVGWALHANTDKDRPCHRVVDRNGRLAPNFAFDGSEEQRRRLMAEDVKFKDEMHVELDRHLWRPKPEALNPKS